MSLIRVTWSSQLTRPLLLTRRSKPDRSKFSFRTNLSSHSFAVHDDEMASDTAGKGVLLKSDLIAGAFRDEIKAGIAQSPAARAPKLVGILATAAAPSKFYADFTKKQCDELGVEFVLKTVGSAADTTLSDGEGVEEAIIEANEDDSVDGIMVGITLRFRNLCSCTDVLWLWQ